MGKNSFYWSSIHSIIQPSTNISVVPTTHTFSYQSGLNQVFSITSDADYTITTGVSWLSIDITSGTTGVILLTVETLLTNSGVSNWVQSDGIIIQSLDLLTTVYIPITQTFEPQPLLFIMTDGDVFEGEIV